MKIIIINRSTKLSLNTTQKIISQVLEPIYRRVNAGDIPMRVLIQLIKNLKKIATKSTSIKVFISTDIGYKGFKCIEIGKPHAVYEKYTHALSHIDKELKEHKIINKIWT